MEKDERPFFRVWYNARQTIHITGGFSMSRILWLGGWLLLAFSVQVLCQEAGSGGEVKVEKIVAATSVESREPAGEGTEFEAAVKSAAIQAAQDGRMIVGIADRVPVNAEITRLQAMSRLIAEAYK
jgi:hypothetical protein